MSDDLKQLLADLELLDGIEKGAVSPIELAHRTVVLGDSNELLVVPRGFYRDAMMRENVDPDDPESPTVGVAAWAEFLESEEYLAWYAQFVPDIPPPKSFQPETESDAPTPVRELEPEPEGTSSHVVKIIRRALRR